MRLPTTKNKKLPNARSKPNTRSRRRFPSYTWGASASAAQGANQRPLTARPTITTMVIVITKNIKLITDQFYIIVYHTECLPLAFPINRGPQFVACNQGSLIINYEDTWLRFWELVFSANCILCTSFTISTCFVSNPCTFPIGRHWQKPHIGELQLATILWLNKHCSSSADPSQLPARNWSHPV